MYRTTLLMPKSLRRSVSAYAARNRTTLSHLVRSHLEGLVPPGTQRTDPLFEDFKPFTKSVGKNLALHHDDDLYGRVESKRRRKP